MSNLGYVYCLTIPRMPGVVKIGYTTKTMEQRMRDLDNTSVVEPFQIYYAGRVRNPLSVEKKIHEIYREWRIRPNREYFEVDADQVKRVIQLAEVAGMGADEERPSEVSDDANEESILEVIPIVEPIVLPPVESNPFERFKAKSRTDKKSVTKKSP